MRAGCFCAHPYLLRLMNVGEAQAREHRAAVRGGDKSALPGAVRMSFGLYNDERDVDAAVEALATIRAGRVRGCYRLDPATGEHLPEVAPFNLDDLLPAALRAEAKQ
ncbi:MAG: hypothetical protein HY260_06720, partial [Chloroflexi bacterium]|nr:hypothetical protein [Chloroflexota bacterium]